jgi:calcium-dependent protein kinase
MSSSSEEEKIYDVISKALLSLCEEKPNDPVDFLSRKMLELIGEGPLVRIKDSIRVDRQTNENAVIKMEKIAIQNLQKDFFENYKIIEEISVNNYLIEDLKLGDSNGQKCARIIDKSLNKISLSDRMITTLINLSHPNLVRIIEILEDDKYFYIIHDYCPGKDLFTYFYNNREKVTQALIKKVLSQVLSALSYLHRAGVIYKNICPSKILVYNAEFDPNDIQIKLSDLINNTEIFSKKSFIYKGYGNQIQDPLFIAPEFVEKKYNNKVDIWGVGILAYLLFVGKEPFTGNKHEIIYQISNKKIEYPSTLSNVKKDLLRKMLNKNPNERYEADDLLKEEYFHDTDAELVSEEPKDDKEFLNVVNSMCTLTVGKNLRKSVMSYIIARKLYKENDTKIRKIFESLDEDKNGFIEKNELLAQYKKHFPGTTENQLKIINRFMESGDVDNNGRIDYAEFLTMMNLGNKEIGEKTLKEVFDYYDVDKNGFIEPSDIREIFEDTGLSNKEVHQLIDECDVNQDRKLGFEEFYKIITSSF